MPTPNCVRKAACATWSGIGSTCGSRLTPPAPANRNAIAVVTLTPGAGVVQTVVAATEMNIVCEINRGVTLDSTGSFDPDLFPVTPLGRLWAERSGTPPVWQSLATGIPTFVFVPSAGGTRELEFWVSDGVNGAPTAIPLPVPPPAPPSPALPVSPNDAFRIHVTAIAAVIAAPQPVPPIGSNIALDSAPSIVAGTDTRTWRIESGPGAGQTATGNTFSFVRQTGQLVSLTIGASSRTSPSIPWY